MRVSLPQHQHQNLFNIHYATFCLFIFIHWKVWRGLRPALFRHHALPLQKLVRWAPLFVDYYPTVDTFHPLGPFCLLLLLCRPLISPRHHHQFIFELYFTLCTRNNKTTFYFSGGGRRDNASLIFQVDYRKNTQPEVGASHTQEQQ